MAMDSLQTKKTNGLLNMTMSSDFIKKNFQSSSLVNGQITWQRHSGLEKLKKKKFSHC